MIRSLTLMLLSIIPTPPIISVGTDTILITVIGAPLLSGALRALGSDIGHALASIFRLRQRRVPPAPPEDPILPTHGKGQHLVAKPNKARRRRRRRR